MYLKSIYILIAMILVPFTCFAGYSQDQIWVGKLTDTTPRNSEISQEYCNAHVPNTYEARLSNLDKEAIGDNGIKIVDAKSSVMKEGGKDGITIRHGFSYFVGTYKGKEFKDKVEYYAQTLQEVGPTQGVWFTEKCKGFYYVGPK